MMMMMMSAKKITKEHRIESSLEVGTMTSKGKNTHEPHEMY